MIGSLIQLYALGASSSSSRQVFDADTREWITLYRLLEKKAFSGMLFICSDGSRGWVEVPMKIQGQIKQAEMLGEGCFGVGGLKVLGILGEVEIALVLQ